MQPEAIHNGLESGVTDDPLFVEFAERLQAETPDPEECLRRLDELREWFRENHVERWTIN